MYFTKFTSNKLIAYTIMHRSQVNKQKAFNYIYLF